MCSKALIMYNIMLYTQLCCVALLRYRNLLVRSSEVVCVFVIYSGDTVELCRK